jgi:hypothetical protein
VQSEGSSIVAPAHPLRREADPGSYFDELHGAFRSAEDRHASTVTNLVVAGHRVQVRTAGLALVEPLGRAVAHLVDEADEQPSPDLTVCLFDTESTGVAPPYARWGPEHVRERGLVEGFVDDRYLTVFQVVTGQLSMLDREQRLAVCWMRSSDGVPMPERAAPLWRLLHAWLADRRLLLVHGAAVGLADGGVLIVGPGGAGKSCSTLACLGSRLGIAGDDYVVVEVGSEPRVHSIYNSAKVHPSNLDRMPFLRSLVSDGDIERDAKALVFLQEDAPHALSPGFPIRAVVVPQVADVDAARVAPVSRAEVMRALAPSSVLLSPHTARAVMPSLVDLIRSVPVFRLQVGTDARSIPDAILRVLDSLRQDGVAS